MLQICICNCALLWYFNQLMVQERVKAGKFLPKNTTCLSLNNHKWLQEILFQFRVRKCICRFLCIFLCPKSNQLARSLSKSPLSSMSTSSSSCTKWMERISLWLKLTILTDRIFDGTWIGDNFDHVAPIVSAPIDWN